MNFADVVISLIILAIIVMCIKYLISKKSSCSGCSCGCANKKHNIYQEYKNDSKCKHDMK